jgi:SP family general alpha glucoside:H+ symporter-like MFS transporter
VRATVLNELRAGQLQEEDGSATSGEMEVVTALERDVQNTRELGLETITIDACIEMYLRRIQPVVPLLTAEVLREEANRTSTSLLSRQFILSFCAYVVTFGKILNDPLFPPSVQASEVNYGQKLLEEALRIQNPERVTQPDGLSVYISFFLYGAHAGLGNYRQGWFWLREATTLFMMLKGEEELGTEAYSCLFWVLVVSER